MKKYLFSILTLLLSSISYSQNGEHSTDAVEISDDIKNQLDLESRSRANQAQNREDINGWVSFERTMYDFVYGGPSSFFTYGQVITPDSLPRVSFTGGVFNSFTHSFGQIFDPTAEDLDIVNLRLSEADGYQIDSIGFPCIYRRVNHNGIDDTLIITVALTNKETSGVNPYDGSFIWNGGGLLSGDISVISPSYLGTSIDNYHDGLTGTSDGDVIIKKYKFALTSDDLNIFWRAFPVDISAGPDQVVYTNVEFKPSFTSSINDTAFVFNGALGAANTNSFRTLYDYPQTPETGYFFDLYRDDQFSYNASYVTEDITRYMGHTGTDAWRNGRLSVYSWWGFRFEYYMTATSSLNIEKNNVSDFTIFPNPSNDKVLIHLNDDKGGKGLVEILDLSGRIVYSNTSLINNQLQLDVKEIGISKGTYLVKLTIDNVTITKKLIVK